MRKLLFILILATACYMAFGAQLNLERLYPVAQEGFEEFNLRFAYPVQRNFEKIEQIINADDVTVAGTGTFVGGLIVPSGTTPTPEVEGAFFLDTDASANGDLLMYGNGAWRTLTSL